MGIIVPIIVAVGAVAAMIVLINQVPEVQSLVLQKQASDNPLSLGDSTSISQSSGSYLATSQVKMSSMSLDTNGFGTIVLSNNGSADDRVLKIAVKNVGTAVDDGKAIANPVVSAKSSQSTVIFHLNDGVTFSAPASGQQVTAVISMASGTTITQTLTVVAASSPPSSGTFSTGPQVRIQSMNLDTNGVGMILLSNNSNSDDAIVKVEVKNVGVVTASSTGGISNGVLPANTSQHQVYFNLKAGSLSYVPITSGQQVTSVISLASGATITQTLTVTASDSYTSGPQVRIHSMSLDTTGLGTVVLSNRGNTDDKVVKIEVKIVGTIVDNGGTNIWLVDTSGNPSGPGVVAANATEQQIDFNLSRDLRFSAPSSGQQVTAVISMASGATITQTLTVVA